MKVASRGDGVLGDACVVLVVVGNMFFDMGMSLAWKNLDFGSSWSDKVAAWKSGLNAVSSIPLASTRLGVLRSRFDC